MHLTHHMKKTVSLEDSHVRQFVRLSTPISVCLGLGQDSLQTHLQDISAGGFRVKLSQFFEVGELVYVKLDTTHKLLSSLPQQTPFRLLSQIVWRTPDNSNCWHFGMEFIALTLEQNNQLQYALNQTITSL